MIKKINKEISNLILYEIDNCKKNIENILLKTNLSDYEKLKIWESSLQKELNEIQKKLWNFNVFEVSLNNILNNEIVLTDKALQKLKIKDILEQIDDLEVGNNENLNNTPTILFNIIDNISMNEEVKVYLDETNLDISKLKAGIHKLFYALLNNIAITAAPKDENQRKQEYHKLLKGYKVIAQILKDSTIEPILKLGNIIMISEVSNYCASGWKDTLLELMTKFSFEIKEKYRDSINLDYEKDPLKKVLNEIFFNARECITKDLSYQYINDKNVSIAERPHYIDIFKQVFNEVYNLNLPFIETTDSYLGKTNQNTIKESFIGFLKNKFVNDLIYDKACELFYDRLKEEPDFYIGTKIKPKFWGDIMEWSKKYYHNNNLDKEFSNPVEFMSEYIIGSDSQKNPIRYIAIKEIMKDCGFIEEIIKGSKYGNEYYHQQPEISMGRLKRGIMDIKSEKELNQLNKDLINIHSRGIDTKILIDFIIDHNKYELISHINLDNFNYDINEVDEHGVTKLMRVCQNCNDLNFIKYLINAKVNINHQDKSGLTALMYAIRYNKNIEVSKFLIEHGAKVELLNNYNWSALMYACRYSEDLEFIQLLIHSGSQINEKDKSGWTALMHAIRYNKNMDIPKFLIEQGADISLMNNENRTALMYACSISKNLEFIKLLINKGSNIHQQDRYGWTALIHAIRYNNNNTEISKFLIEQGVDINLLNNENRTALMYACHYSDDLEFIQLLIRMGSNINQQDKDRCTALMLAIRYNKNINIAQFLIESGANVNLSNSFCETALMYACHYLNDLEFIQLLIQSGSSINQQDKNGWTALMYAIRYNKNIGIIKYLIESGANVNLIDNDDWNALMFACRYSEDLELIKLLVNAGSNLYQQGYTGWTAFLIARQHNPNPDILKFLTNQKHPVISFVNKILK